jgi:hypothetical protein
MKQSERTMDLTIDFFDEPDNSIKEAARHLESQIAGIKVEIAENELLGRPSVPSPIAVFHGETQTHEYGKQAVGRLIDDIRYGRIR